MRREILHTGMCIPGRETCRCLSQGTGTCLILLRNSVEISKLLCKSLNGSKYGKCESEPSPGARSVKSYLRKLLVKSYGVSKFSLPASELEMKCWARNVAGRARNWALV